MKASELKIGDKFKTHNENWVYRVIDIGEKYIFFINHDRMAGADIMILDKNHNDEVFPYESKSN